MSFTDREDAGRRLGERLRPEFRDSPDVVVLGLPRGGVPVAFEVAQALDAPLDILLVHKLGVPFQPELAMGAVGDGGYVLLDERTVRWAGVTPDELAEAERSELAELGARGGRLRQGRAPAELRGRTVVIVDDGAATGMTALAACHLARAADARRVVVALPVASTDAVAALRAASDEVVCLEVPRSFGAVGLWYADFSQTSDEAVIGLLERADAARSAREHDPPDRAGREVRIPCGGGVVLDGTLVPPLPGHGVVVFAHGSGSSRHSPRNRYVAQVLSESGLGTLLFDLLTPTEESDRSLVFDVDLLAGRLRAATSWLRSQGLAQAARAGSPRIGYFGASTGAAAALAAAATGQDVDAVVSRGGRPDLAGAHLERVRAPTLLIVGGRDTQVLALNEAARRQLQCDSSLEIVPGASHLFEEPGTLASAAGLARRWFQHHLSSPDPSQVPAGP